jgi:hypothetical protein
MVGGTGRESCPPLQGVGGAWALELIEKRLAGGSVEHFYRGAKPAIFTEADLQDLPESIRGGFGGFALQSFVGVMVQALTSGSFGSRDDVFFTWNELTLDEPAWNAMIKMLTLTWQRIASLEDEAAARMEKTGEEGFRVVFNLSGFEAPAIAST